MVNPPVYELVDSSGTVVGEFNQEVANNLLRISNEQTNTEIQVKNGEVDYQSNDINNVDSVDATSVSTDEISITEGSARIYQTAGQTIATATVTTVDWDQSKGSHTPGDVLTVDLPNNKITIEKDGSYLLDCRVAYGSAGDGTRVLTALKADGVKVDQQDIPTGANEFIGPQASTIVTLTTTPTDITAETFQNSGSSQDTAGSEPFTHLSVGRLG